MPNQVHAMNFAAALAIIQSGERCTRAEWGSDQVFVHLDELGTISLTRPVSPRETQSGTFPWQPAQADMMGQDWKELTDA